MRKQKPLATFTAGIDLAIVSVAADAGWTSPPFPGRTACVKDPAAFIRANTALVSPPLIPELKLYLASEALELWEKTEEELQEIGLPPPYWAFAWAGGQALARYVLDNPETVAGKSVLDVASGSGIVAIAACKAGALKVEASEIDAIASAAIDANAAANTANIETVSADRIGSDNGWEVILVGDAFYEKQLADRLLPWLNLLAARGAEILLGDPGRSYFPENRFKLLTSYRVPVNRALEDGDIKATSVWRLQGVSRPALVADVAAAGVAWEITQQSTV